VIVKREREEPNRDDETVDEPSGTPPDEGKAFDPEMTESDEANIPADSDADPGSGPAEGGN
jgi:hypothetical protein